MHSRVVEAMEGLKGLGSAAELRAMAGRGIRPAQRPRVNAHIHLPPNFSAFGSVTQAVELAGAQGVRVLGVSNYYDYEVYGDFASLARRAGIFPLFGLEIIALVDGLVKAGVKINDPGNPGKLYICGKGITALAPMNEEATELLGIIRRNDRQRMAKVVEKLENIFASRGSATGLSEGAVIDMVVRRHECRRERVYLQERHVCQAFQEALFEKAGAEQRERKLAEVLGAASKAGGDAVKVQNEIRSHLMKAGKPAYVEETFVSAEQAFRLILALGGIPCYPTLADGASPVCEYEADLDSLIDELRRNHIHAVEFIPIRNTPEVLGDYVRAMRSAGFAITAGTEHNTLDLLPIEPTCLNGQPVPEDVKEIFWEGACVVAAHQFLSLHGECGFVDARGEPNRACASAEERIGEFARLGAAVIRRYFERSAVPVGHDS